MLLYTKKFQNGGLLRQFKLKNPFLTLQPLYTNPTVGLGMTTPSMELGLEGNYGKKKEWTIEPHIGLGYNTLGGKIPLTGGINASYKGMANPSHTGNAVVNLGAGYNSSSPTLKGVTLGFDAGYQFNFGAKNRRKGEIKPGAIAGSLMPYGGANATDGLIYGGRGNFEWRPKFGNKAPFTVFGGANLNFAPVTGKGGEKPSVAETVTGETDPITGEIFTEDIVTPTDNVKFKPTFGAHLGVKIPLHRIVEHLPSFNLNSLPYPKDPLPLQGDTTYAQREPELSDRGKDLLGTYDETFEQFKKRKENWLKGKSNSKFINDDIRYDNSEFPWQGRIYTDKKVELERKGGILKYQDGGIIKGFGPAAKRLEQEKAKATEIKQPPAYHFKDYFLDLQKQENSQKEGYDSETNTWAPHPSVEGGAPTIAYGHKLQPGEDFSKLTEAKALDLLRTDLYKHINNAQNIYDTKFGVGSFAKLPVTARVILTDYSYNGVLEKFDKFMAGIHANDKDKIFTEYKRFSKGKELTNRNAWTEQLLNKLYYTQPK